MKILIMFLAAAFLCSGCLSPTETTIEVYSPDGKLVQKYHTSESIGKTVTESTKEKLVFVNDQSWLFGIVVVPPASEGENISGAFKILAGKQDKQVLTVPKGIAEDSKYLPALISAARAGDVSVGVGGIASKSEYVGRAGEDIVTINGQKNIISNATKNNTFITESGNRIVVNPVESKDYTIIEEGTK